MMPPVLRRLSLGLITALALGQAGAAFAQCTPNALDLRTAGGVVRFSVEVADTGAERSKGLMFRKSMATSAGMLFVYETPRAVSFWMKNTLIPLDMIFADATGTVTRVHENAVPGNLKPVDGGAGVKSVLEINGGVARRLGIGEGTVLRHGAIDPSRAAWPCD